MGSMQAKIPLQEIESLPEVLRETVLRRLEALDSEDVAPSLRATLIRVIACSEFATNTIAREWSWFLESQDRLYEVPRIDELRLFAAAVADSGDAVDRVKQNIRRFRHRFLLQVLWREVAGVASLEETLGSLSDLADELLGAAAAFGGKQLRDRFGVVRDGDGDPVSIVVLGMGKLGGRELNFSSDIDLVFLFPEGAESDGGKCISAQEYFTRWSRNIVALLDEVTADGFAFRIDTRLRPFGDSGPPVTSFAALESYLTQHGRDWERYAYVKARIVGPRPTERVERELMQDLVKPFVYRRYLDYGVFESLREMQSLIAAEVERRDMADNVKLGPGGIREIEFIVQSLQLVRGGNRSDLQGQALLHILPNLAGRKGLRDEDVAALRNAYVFLRRIENFIQAMRDRQTHDLPTSDADRACLCVAMGYHEWDALLVELNKHRAAVTAQFEAIAFRDGGRDDPARQQLTALWDTGATAMDWAAYFEEQGYAQAPEIADIVTRFSAAPGTQRVSGNARDRLRDFIPALLLLLRERLQPAAVLQRVFTVVEQVLRRSAYIALLNENAQTLVRLVDLCERSAYITQQIARYPALFDELLDPRIYSARIARHELESELRTRLVAAEAGDSESRMAVLGQFQRAAMFRIAVADFTGRLPIMQVSDALTDLAEAVLDFALEVAWDDMTGKHGTPEYAIDGETRRAGFGVIAYGKLGGIELSYGSDLDLVFLHDSHGEAQQTNGEKPLDNTMFFARLLRRLVHFLTTQTGSGSLYEIDMRLRPDGQSGLLVTSLDAFEKYQDENAWTWEHQALLRARPVAGSAIIAREFERIRADTLTSRVHRDSLRDDVAGMRDRMRGELDKSNGGLFDMKQGRGGIGDIEFIVQYLVLANAADHRAVIHYPDNIRQLATLAKAGCIDEDTALRLQDIYRSYRLRLHHLRLNEKKPLVPEQDFADERADVVRQWEGVLGADVS